jgi:tetrahydromethanopterin S-methyltransferase subunit A
MNKHTFSVAWSEEDREWVGTCAGYTYLSNLDKSPIDALGGIIELVNDIESSERDKMINAITDDLLTWPREELEDWGMVLMFDEASDLPDEDLLRQYNAVIAKKPLIGAK